MSERLKTWVKIDRALNSAKQLSLFDESENQ